MRKLASIQRIRSLEPIPGADAIEKAQVLGWNLVVKKGEFKVGDFCVYCEIDSVMPDRPEFEFLRSRSNMRIKTVKLRGQVSQGIAFPISILASVLEEGGYSFEEGEDITEILGVVKYEPPIPAHMSGVMKGPFPGFIPKTDETRIQVLQDLLDKYVGVPFYGSEKLDGSSTTMYLRNGEFGVCSRNIDLVEDADNSFWKVAREMDIERKLKMLSESLRADLAFQGELIGEGVQGNKLKLRGQTVRFFDIFNISEFRYLDFEAFKWAMDLLKLPTVPVIHTNFSMINDIEELVRMAELKSMVCPDVWIEGLVFRPMGEVTETHPQLHNGRVSFKAINPKFLLKYGE